MSHLAYRKDIDALRGIAVLLVVIYHAFPAWLPGGFIGVDVFFVISGYLITSIINRELSDGKFSFQSFYSRRIRRLFPALVCVLCFSLAAGWLFLFTDEFQQLGRHVAYSTVFLQNFNLISELGYFDVDSHYKPLLHLWTLSIEEQYYLFWPITLWVLFRLKANLVWFSVFIIVSSFVANVYFVQDYKNEVFFNTVTRVWELGLGSLLALLQSSGRLAQLQGRPTLSVLMLVFGVGLIGVGAFYIDGEMYYPFWIGLLPTFGALLIIIANVRVKYWAGLVAVGLISYPLYLWHWVILSFLYIYLGQMPGELELFVALVFSVLLSFFTYRYVERLRYIKSGKVVLGLLVAAIMIGAIGRYIEKQDGLPDRRHLGYLDKFNVEFIRTPKFDTGCESYLMSVVKEQRLIDYCRSNLKAHDDKVVALIGDSHAHVMFPGMAETARSYGYGTVLLANSSCPPMISFLWGKNDREINECQKKIHQILGVIEVDSRIQKVVFATRGPVYFHGDVKEKFTLDSVQSSLDRFTVPEVLNYETYFAGFGNTLERLQGLSHVKNVYYFLENPELDFLPKEIVPRPFDVLNLSVRDSYVERSLYQIRMKKYKEMAMDVGHKFSKVKIVDVEPFFCDREKCFTYKDGNFLYADNDHLSVYGSLYLARRTENIVFE